MIDFGVTEQKAQELAKRMQALGLGEQDLEESFVRSTGPGGQHVNKTSTCVVLTHPATGVSVKVQDSRSQALNRYHARKRLCEVLEARLLGKASPQAQRIARLRKQKDRRRRRHKPSHEGPA
ncbi:MAG: peptide chain release factor-like protein [Phycisphaerae bacterium]|nr:peptide chain release factor-like protein [Phycisphaerae bacterium]